MKKITFSLLMLLMVVGSAFGQCVNTTQFGSTTADNSGAVQTMTTCLFEQEWRGATGLIIGSDYEFTTTAGYITITDDSNNVLVHGTSPVTVSAVTVTSLRAHINTDGACGTATNCRTVTLQNLTPPLPPANDLCPNAIEITSSGIVAGTTLVATTAGEAFCGTSNTAPDVWYYFDDLSGTGFDVDLDLCNGSTGYDSKLSVYSGACGGLACVAGNDDFCGLQSGLSFTTDGSSRYYILVHGFGSGSGDFELNVQGIIVGAPPVISCPMDITSSNDPGACGAVVNFADAIAIDLEDGVITATQTAGLPSGSEFPLGVSTVEFTATDSDSNSVSCTFTVTVVDDEDPVIACADITVELDANGMYTLLPGEVATSATDNCPGETVEFLVSSGGGGGTSTLTTIFGGNNGAAGNMFDIVALNDVTINSFDVNLATGSTSDMEVYFKTGPYVGSVNTPGDWTLVGSVGAVASLGTDVATPLGLTLGIDVAAGDTVAFYVTSTTNTMNYTNGSTTGALFASDANIEFYEGAGNTYPFNNNFNPRVFNGNIIYDTPSLVPAASIAFDCASVGVNAVTVQITDGAGNTATCMANVTVEDNIAPVISCIGAPGNFSESEDFEAATIPTGWTSDIAVGVQDWEFGSGDLPTGDDFPSFAAIFNDDAAGSGEVNVGTLSSPVYDLSAALSANLSYEVAFQEFGDQEFAVEVWDGAAWVQLALYDEDLDPDIQAESFDVSAYVNAAFQVRFAYDDLGGWGWHAAIDNFVVDYEEVSTPLDVVLDANGMATINASDLLFTVDEACGWSATTGGTSSNTLETTFAGGNGFNGNMFDIVAINDVTVNSFDVNLAAGVVDDVEVYFKTGTYVGSETDASAWTLLGSVNVTSAGDGVPTPLGMSLGQAIAAGDTAAFYVTTIGGTTMNYTNGTAAGAVFASDANIEFLEGAGGEYPFNVTFVPRVFNGNIIYDASTVSTTIDLDCSQLGENQFEVTVTDDSGNVSTCIATVNVLDETAPILVCADTTIELGEDGTAVVDPEALLATLPSSYEVITISSDNQSGTPGNTDFTVDVTADETVSFDWSYSTDDGPGFDGFGYLVNGVYTEVTDPAGANNQTGSTTVALLAGDVFGFRSSSVDGGFGAATTVISNFMPGFEGQFDPANWTLDLDNSDGDAFFVEIPGGPLSFDACGITVLAVDVTEVTCADIGTPITVTVFASDASGNIAACTAVITVVDLLGPVITCPADQTVDPGEGNLFYEVPDYFATGEATVTDNCTDPVTITSQDPAVGELISDGVYTVTLTAEDEYGNIGECTFELTVESVLGLDDNKLDSAISMYPNPAHSNVTISNSSNILLDKAAIYDTNGRLIQTIDLRDMQQEKTFDVSALATGVYMVQIQGENASAVKRLVKE